MLYLKAVALAALGLGAFSTSGLAHHSTNSIYDEGKVVEITGVVKEWRMVNPHPYLTVEVPSEDGQLTAYDVSFGGSAVSHLSRRGFTPETFKSGEVIVVTGHPARAEGVYGVLVEGGVTREDGTPIP